jgi:hypothetical protein
LFQSPQTPFGTGLILPHFELSMNFVCCGTALGASVLLSVVNGRMSPTGNGGPLFELGMKTFGKTKSVELVGMPDGNGAPLFELGITTELGMTIVPEPLLDSVGGGSIEVVSFIVSVTLLSTLSVAMPRASDFDCFTAIKTRAMVTPIAQTKVIDLSRYFPTMMDLDCSLNHSTLAS